jgi:hypothetical protein
LNHEIVAGYDGSQPLDVFLVVLAKERPMNHSTRLTVLGLIGWSLPAFAEDLPPAPPIAGAFSVEFEPRWLDELRSNDFRVREEASRQLYEAGESAVGPICRAIPKMDHESATRAVDVLDKLSQSADAATKSAASDGLKELEESEIPAVASLARSVRLKHEERPELKEVRGARAGILLRGGFNIRMGGNGFGMNIRRVGGERTAKLSEPGRKVEFSDSNGRNIRMRVTETVDGKEKVTEYAAQDAEELAARHPEAVPFYERVTGQQPGIELPAARVPIRERGPAEHVQDPNLKQEIDDATQKLRERMQRVAELRAAGKTDDQAQKEYEEAKKELLEIAEKLRR